MGRKLRLSVHRKNEFRKKQAKKQRYTVTVRESLPISLTLDKVTVLKISIPKDMLLVSSINELSCRLQTMAVVPKGWITLPTQSSCRQCFVRCEEDILGNFQVSLSVTINPDMSWEASVQGHKLLPSCGVFSSLPQVVRTVSDIKTVLHYVDSCCICVGNDDEKFEPLVSSRKGNFMDSSGTSRVAYYDSERKTIRRDDCTLLISGENVKRCGSCEEYRQNLNRMLYRYEHSKGKDPDKADHHSHTNYRYLTSPEKVQRMMALHSQMRICKRQISRLYVCIDNLIEQRSVEVDDDLDKHLKSITEQYSSTIAESHPEGSFARSFWESQCKALSLKNMKSMRWDPVIIRWCLYLRHLSGSSAYEMLRESGVIKLPSQRTLRDYTYYTKAAAGFSDDVDKQLMEAAKIDACAEHEKFVVLLMDEMHIKEDLVYDKHSGSIIGFCNLGDINSHLIALEKQDSKEQSPELANSMLVFLVRGLFTNLSFPYSQFPCTALSGESMFDPVWEAVSRLELCGFKVLALTCDGLAANRRLFRLHNPDAGANEVVHKVPNPYAEDGRDLYFLADPPHLIKTVRNAWYNSKRHLWCNGKDISWSHLVKLYHRNRSADSPGLAMITKLKYEHVWPTSYSKMRVDLAAQVLSNQVANGIRFTQGAEAEETATFVDNFDKFFDCLNVSNHIVGKHTRNTFKNPYRKSKSDHDEDFRLKWLEGDMMGYLEKWEESVTQREGYKDLKNEQNMMLLPLETRQGIQITVKSFVEIVRYLFTIPGVELFYSNRLCQDSLENFFGQQRQRGRTDENPNADQFVKNSQALRVINSTCATARGNCRAGEIDPKHEKKRHQMQIENNAPLRKRPRHSKKTQ